MNKEQSLSLQQRAIKRAFDVVVATVLLIIAWPLLVVSVAASTVDTGSFGLFRQTRVGRHAAFFSLYKVRTMRSDIGVTTTVTARGDARITRFGAVLRRAKVDELPQLVNVLLGDMSLVGPRPDVPGFADILEGTDRIILSVRPGITSFAALAYRDEEVLLGTSVDPVAMNRNILWPHKVRLNVQYVRSYSFSADIRCILDTISGRPARSEAVYPQDGL